jgi:hypothetical protein
MCLVGLLLGDSQALDYDSCMHTTRAASAVTKTLVFHIYYSCVAPLLGHALTAIPPTHCALMMVSISVLTPSITRKNNG